jgi:4-alpha-glucanotransferase
MQVSDDWWEIKLDLSNEVTPIAYKYGVYNTAEKRFVRFEEGDNRLLYTSYSHLVIHYVHDGFVRLQNNNWKGAGIAIPVFSLRSNNSFGVGEFTDIKLLADWASATGLKMIQLLPINDTIATNTWLDSYPYAAISAFALHPLYINIATVAGTKFAHQLRSIGNLQEKLNSLSVVDYEEVMKVKLQFLRSIFEESKVSLKTDENYQLFFSQNNHWLKPYAAFCYYRDLYHTSVFNEWETNSTYDKKAIDKLFTSRATSDEVGFYCFVQFHLHVQLKDAVSYAHSKGLALKGDIPIGIYRYGCDAWVAPHLYNMNWQAGAPPDDFTAIGQNWGFPTYNWAKMQEDDFLWWRQRFEQMTNYFDAFRIDHILGFFRIWSIPLDAVQGILGRFVPCTPVHISEFTERGIHFDYNRFCKPYITDQIIHQLFSEQAGLVYDHFVDRVDGNTLMLKEDLQTQVAIAHYIHSKADQGFSTEFLEKMLELVANVLLFEDHKQGRNAYHFRISIEKTTSFQELDEHTKRVLKDLYVDYFYKRQDEFWYKEAMHKLPKLKAATNMLICGEDLGMVPHCVPDVMQQNGILSLEIQRMPKDPNTPFFNPSKAPYMSVVTPSTHDMSTIRGWWEENREVTQQFYNNQLGQWGDAPFYCEAWINRAIVLQHLYSPAMWSIFQLQDILGMSETLRRKNPKEERINDPANPKNYWQYRMHISLEQLLSESTFNTELRSYLLSSGRAK